jgi:hypothetical protein
MLPIIRSAGTALVLCFALSVQALAVAPTHARHALAAPDKVLGAPVTFSLLPVSPAISSCLAGAQASVTIVPGSQTDTLTLHADHLPPLAGFELYSAALPHQPFGPIRLLSALQADDQGVAQTTVQALLLGAPALAAIGGTAPMTPASHLVLAFRDLEDAGPCGSSASTIGLGPAALATIGFPDDAGPLLRSPLAMPGLGFAPPGGGHGLALEAATFTAICSDPDGWQSIRFVDFRFTAAGKTVFWVRLDRPAKRMYVYDTAGGRWRGPGIPGSTQVLRTPYGALYLRDSAVAGTPGTTGRVIWSISFTSPVRGQTLQQSIRVTDQRFQTRGWNSSGTWAVG